MLDFEITIKEELLAVLFVQGIANGEIANICYIESRNNYVQLSDGQQDFMSIADCMGFVLQLMDGLVI